MIVTLNRLMTTRGVPFRRYYGPELTARAIREWLEDVGAKTLYIEPGSPWENDYIEGFNGKQGDQLLDRGIFYTRTVVKVLTAQCNQLRPHSSFRYRPPAPETILPTGYSTALVRLP